jgi:hypothetical protein
VPLFGAVGSVAPVDCWGLLAVLILDQEEAGLPLGLVYPAAIVPLTPLPAGSAAGIRPAVTVAFLLPKTKLFWPLLFLLSFYRLPPDVVDSCVSVSRRFPLHSTLEHLSRPCAPS